MAGPVYCDYFNFYIDIKEGVCYCKAINSGNGARTSQDIRPGFYFYHPWIAATDTYIWQDNGVLDHGFVCGSGRFCFACRMIWEE